MSSRTIWQSRRTSGSTGVRMAADLWRAGAGSPEGRGRAFDGRAAERMRPAAYQPLAKIVVDDRADVVTALLAAPVDN